MLDTAKDPAKVRAGIAGSHARWGPRRVVRLDALHPTVAAAVRALIEADQATKKATTESQNPVVAGDHGGSRDHDAA